MDKNNRPIGIFDSGLGGLTVFREVMNQMPNESLVYFGDTARVPYGSKSKETILHYTRQILSFLDTQDVKAIVVACNTVSAYALEEVRNEVKVPIIGVVKPGAFVAANATKNQKIGVIGTEGTVKSGLYVKMIQEKNPNVQVFQKPCPLFVPLVEEGLWKDPITSLVVERYLNEMKAADVDTLIMGCTHYPLLKDTIQETMGNQVRLINPAYETSVQLQRMLTEANLIHRKDTTALYHFYVSDDPEKFKGFAEQVLQMKADQMLVEKVRIEEF